MNGSSYNSVRTPTIPASSRYTATPLPWWNRITIAGIPTS